MDQLTNDDIVVLWGGSNDVARNNSVVGMKHILDLLIYSSHTNVIVLSVSLKTFFISSESLPLYMCALPDLSVAEVQVLYTYMYEGN
jgi:hypothetical protein